jgi:hypothetical protein
VQKQPAASKLAMHRVCYSLQLLPADRACSPCCFPRHPHLFGEALRARRTAPSWRAGRAGSCRVRDV